MKNSRKTLLAFLAVALTAGALLWNNGAAPSKDITWDDVVEEARAGGYRLISTVDLWKRYSEDRDGLLLVDTRQEWEFRTGHIEGALNFPMEPTWYARWRDKGNLAGFLGADKDRVIVFY